MNFIFGTAGFAKEVDWLLEEIFAEKGVDQRADYFVAEDSNELIGTLLNGKKVMSESEFFNNFYDKQINCFVAVGKPNIREKIVTKIKQNCSRCSFPNLIQSGVNFDKRPRKVEMGEGNILCAKSILTTDIKLGNFVHVNLDCTVGHDTTIGSYTTLSPGVHISGNVNICDKVFFGTGAVIIEKLQVCSNSVIGAGATVVRDVSIPGTYIGTPARKIG